MYRLHLPEVIAAVVSLIMQGSCATDEFVCQCKENIKLHQNSVSITYTSVIYHIYYILNGPLVLLLNHRYPPVVINTVFYTEVKGPN